MPERMGGDAMLRVLAGVLVQCAIFAALILGPAWVFGGPVPWPRGVLALGVLATVSALGAVWFQVTDPALARERASTPRAQTAADALAMLAIATAVVAWFVFVSWDVHSLHLPNLPTIPSLAAGFGVFLVGVATIVWTFRVNSFAATTVKVQEERAQRVIDTGPYAFVRHPMYFGAMLFFSGLGLILGSSVGALLALPLFGLAFTPRVVVEEAVLRRDLPGYADYQSRVRARLFPGLL